MSDRELIEREAFRLLANPESEPVLKAILDVRARAAGTFTPEFSGQRFEDYNRGLLDTFKAVQQAMITALADRLEALASRGGLYTCLTQSNEWGILSS